MHVVGVVLVVVEVVNVKCKLLQYLKRVKLPEYVVYVSVGVSYLCGCV